MQKKIYIAGKISGLPIEEYTKNFNDAKEYLESLGYEAVNPVEHTDAEMGWEDCMKICIKLILDCDGIYMLENWDASDGAKIELAFGKYIMKKIREDFLIIYENNK